MAGVEHRQQHPAHRAHRRGAQVDRRLLVLLADRQQPGPHDHHRVGQLEGDQAGDLRRRAQRQRGGQLGDEEQQRDREQVSGMTKDSSITMLAPSGSRPRQRSTPRAKATPSGTVMAVASTPSRRVWISAVCSVASCQTERSGSPQYQRNEKPCQSVRDRPALKEKIDRDEHRQQRPDQIAERDGLQHPRLPARVAPPRTARRAGAGTALSAGARRCRGGRAHDASPSDRALRTYSSIGTRGHDQHEQHERTGLAGLAGRQHGVVDQVADHRRARRPRQQVDGEVVAEHRQAGEQDGRRRSPGRHSGSVTRRKVSSRPAPRSRAASRTLGRSRSRPAKSGRIM